MALNPKAAEFTPSWSSREQIYGPGGKTGQSVSTGSSKSVASPAMPIPLPDDPFSQDYDNIAISPEEAEELERVQSWVEMMADLEESEGDHLIAMAMKYSDKRRIQDMSKHRS